MLARYIYQPASLIAFMKIGLANFIILIILMSIFSYCKKTNKIVADNPFGLPNATRTGANIFACRINDSNWILNQPSIFNLQTSFSRSNSRDSLGFGGNSDGELQLITFAIFDRIKSGSSYRLNDTTKAFVNTFRVLAACGQTIGYGGSQWNKGIDGNITFTRYSGSYTVPSCCTYGTYDPSAIISGTFSFVIAIPDCDSIKVTDGRFDINYSNY